MNNSSDFTNSLLDLFFDRMPMGIAIFDREFRLLHCNPTWASLLERYTALPADQIQPGKHLCELSPGNEEFFESMMERVLAGEMVTSNSDRTQSGGIVSYWDGVFVPICQDGQVSGVLDVVIDVTERVLIEQKLGETLQQLQHRIAFENLILNLSTQFINLPPGEVGSAIEEALKAIGNFTGVDRAYLFTYSQDYELMSCTFEWCAEGVSPQIDNLKDLSIRDMHWSNQQLMQGKTLSIPRVSDLPAEAQAERAEFESQQIESLIAVPLDYQGTVIGFLGFDSLSPGKTWVEDSVNLLKVAGTIFTNALENQRTQQALKVAHDMLEQRVIERTQQLESTNQTLGFEIEQRKQTEELLQISQALYSEVFNNSPQQIFIIEVLENGQFRILMTNPAHQRKSGLDSQNILGKTIEEVVFPEVAQSIKQHYRDCIETGQTIQYLEQAPAPYWDAERVRTFRTTLTPVTDSQGNIVRLVGTSEDITDEKRLEELSMDRARKEAVASERSRLARELHDAVTQTLFSTALTAEVLPRIWEKNPELGRKKLEELRELTRGALAEMRTLLMELRPDAMEEANLADLLGHLVNAFMARASLPVHLSVCGSCDLPVEVKVAFYRIAQEALNNIQKHADAQQVVVNLTGEGEVVTLCIEDDGQGFDPNQQIGSDHYGLEIMAERAAQVRAILELQSQPGLGTKVSLRWQAARL